MLTPAALARSVTAAHGTRDLRLDDSLRSLVASATAHGRRPNRHENATFNQLCINYVVRGRGTYTERSGRTHELVPGTLFHRFPGVLHSTWFDPESEYTEFFLVFDAATGRQLMKLGLIVGEDQPLLTVGLDAAVVEEFKHLAKRIALPENECPSRTAVLETTAFINRMYDRARVNRRLDFWEAIIEDACGMLGHNLEEPLTPEVVAERLGVTYAAFRKHFKQAIGYAPGDYRIRRRLEAAQNNLMGASVKETARKFGYFDSFAFSAQFKRFVGVSPREFKRRMQKSFVPTPLTQRRTARK